MKFCIFKLRKITRILIKNKLKIEKIEKGHVILEIFRSYRKPLFANPKKLIKYFCKNFNFPVTRTFFGFLKHL